MSAIWIENGDIYVSPPDGIKSVVASKIVKQCSKIGTEHPRGSWMHNYELGKKLIKAKTKTFNINKYRIVISPREKGYNYSEEEQYKPHKWKRKIELWKREDEHAYSLIFVSSSLILLRNSLHCCVKIVNSSSEYFSANFLSSIIVL